MNIIFLIGVCWLIIALKMYHLCNSLYHCLHENLPSIARKCTKTINTSYILNVHAQYDVEKQAQNAIFTLKKLERNYSMYEIEEVCRLVLEATNRPTVKSVQTMIKTLQKEDVRKSKTSNSKQTDEKYGFTRGGRRK